MRKANNIISIPRSMRIMSPRKRRPATLLLLGTRSILYFWLAAGVGCMYMTYSGYFHFSQKRQQQQQQRQPQEIPLAPASKQQAVEKKEQFQTNGISDSSFTKETPSKNDIIIRYPLTRQSMMETGQQIARQSKTSPLALQTKHQAHAYFWCHGKPNATAPPEQFLTPQQDTTRQGIFFVKTPKTASQTINRIIRRVAARVGPHLRQTQHQACYLRGHHIRGDPAAWYSHRNPDASILLTSLRDPATRALSRIFWNLSTRQFRGSVQADQLRNALNNWRDIESGCISNGQGGFQLNYISFEKLEPQSSWQEQQPAVVQNSTQIHYLIQQVLEDYDFILVQERLDESLVVLQLLLGLQPTDVLSLPLHVAGSYLYDRHAGCIHLLSSPKLQHLQENDHHVPNQQPSLPPNQSQNVTNFLESYLQSPQWYAQNYGDYVLLGAVHARLDQTIEALGREKFQKALQQFQALQALVTKECSQNVVFPCSQNGTLQRDDYAPGSPKSIGDRYPQQEIEICINQVVQQHEAQTG